MKTSSAFRSVVVVAAASAAVSCDSVTGPTEADCLGNDVASSLRGAAALYSGPLYDTHAHLEPRGAGPRIGCRMVEQGVERAVVFVHMNPDDPGRSERRWAEELGGFPGRWVPFFHVDPKGPADLASERLAGVLAGSSGEYRGIGELALYRDPWRSTWLSDAPWPGVFAFAAERGMWTMIHLRHGMEDDLRQALAAYPDSRILLHGFEFPGELADIIVEHPNLHVTIDMSTILLREMPDAPGLLRPLMFLTLSDADRDVVLQLLRDEWQELVAAALDRWLPVIEAAPDRVFWGTDVAMPWHTEPEAYATLVDFGRLFIQRLPAHVRDAYAHGNARRLFGGGVAIP